MCELLSRGYLMHAGRGLLLSVLVLQLWGTVSRAEGETLYEASAIALTENEAQTVPMRSTDRLPEASGTVRVERRGGMTDIDVELDSMKPASLFGGDYNTYVLWVVPPSGVAESLGEILIDGGHATLHSRTTSLQFAILVSAEPHYLVSAPSAFIVLTNEATASGRKINLPLIEGVYNFDRSSLDNVKEAKGKVHSEVKQAFTAVRLARRAGAASLAGEQFLQAQRALQETIALWRERKDPAEIAAQARETVRLGVVAQRLALDRAFQSTPVRTEGSGGGKVEAERRDLRGTGSVWK